MQIGYQRRSETLVATHAGRIGPLPWAKESNCLMIWSWDGTAVFRFVTTARAVKYLNHMPHAIDTCFGQMCETFGLAAYSIEWLSWG